MIQRINLNISIPFKATKRLARISTILVGNCNSSAIPGYTGNLGSPIDGPPSPAKERGFHIFSECNNSAVQKGQFICNPWELLQYPRRRTTETILASAFNVISYYYYMLNL